MYVNQIIAENAVKFNAFGKIIRSKRGLFGVLHNLKMLYSNHSPFFCILRRNITITYLFIDFKSALVYNINVGTPCDRC